MKTQVLKSIGFIVGLILSGEVQSNSLLQAQQAIDNEDYRQANAILMQAANNGDAAASYNLGLMQQKGMVTSADRETARSWFEKASQGNLVDGYNQLTANTIKPAGDQRITLIQSPQEWIKAQNPNYYTLQLASSTNLKLIEKYYSENQLAGKGGYYKNRRQGEDWYALIYGAYPSTGEANDAIATLPKDLRKWSPWVRKLSTIQRLVR